MFFAFNNGISATAMDVEIANTDHGRFITFARDFQIINGGQTTASISNARYKDKADLNGIYVQMKLTVIDESSPEESDELIRNISRSSNSQNKVSDADFFASHPFHRRMEQISRLIFAPAVDGAQYETKWFYERARGQYLQEQMRLTPAKKNSLNCRIRRIRLSGKPILPRYRIPGEVFRTPSAKAHRQTSRLLRNTLMSSGPLMMRSLTSVTSSQQPH